MRWGTKGVKRLGLIAPRAADAVGETGGRVCAMAMAAQRGQARCPRDTQWRWETSGSNRLAENRGIDLDVDLALGIFSERIPSHCGFELDAFQQREGVNVAQRWTDDRNLVGQAGN